VNQNKCVPIPEIESNGRVTHISLVHIFHQAFVYVLGFCFIQKFRFQIILGFRGIIGIIIFLNLKTCFFSLTSIPVCCQSCDSCHFFFPADRDPPFLLLQTFSRAKITNDD
jgi:hypothetical protein